MLVNPVMTNLDTSICPLCKQKNFCAVNDSNGCWCMNTNIPPALLAKLPKESRNKSCICNACIEHFKQNDS